MAPSLLSRREAGFGSAVRRNESAAHITSCSMRPSGVAMRPVGEALDVFVAKALGQLGERVCFSDGSRRGIVI